MATPLPVLAFGEYHTDFVHAELEIEALRRVKKHGYGTLAVEYPSDMEPAVQTYLASARTEADHRAWVEECLTRELAARGPEAPFLKPAEWEQAIETKRFHVQHILAKKLLEGAADLGYAIHCVDRPVAAQCLPEEDDFKDLDLRTQAMAEGITERARQGEGVVAVVGLAHLINYTQSPSLRVRLAERDIPNWSFALPLDGRSPAGELGIEEEKLAAMVDVVGAGAVEIDGIVKRSLKHRALQEASFDRAGGETTQGTDSLQERQSLQK